MALSYEKFVEKAVDTTLTLGDAIDYALSEPITGSGAKKSLQALRSAFEKNKIGIPLNLPLAEMRKKANWSRLDPRVNEAGTNHFGNFIVLEGAIRPILQESGAINTTIPGAQTGTSISVYPKIAGGKDSGSISNGTQRTGLGGVRPMQGALSLKDMEIIYADAIPKIREEYGEATADLAQYHKATFQRPEQINGGNAIKKTDVILADETVTIKAFTAGTKSRPSLKFKRGSLMADLIIRNYESSTSDKLFDVSPRTYNRAFTKYISPSLLAFEDVLPLVDTLKPDKGVVSTNSVVRHIMARIVREELKLPIDVTEVMMGHEPASILTANYTGRIAKDGVGDIVANLLIGGDIGDILNDSTGSNDSVLTEEERRVLSQKQRAVADADANARIARASAKTAQARVEEARILTDPGNKQALIDAEVTKSELNQIKTDAKNEPKKAVAETEVDFGDLPPHLIEALTNLGSMTSRVRELKEPEKKTDPDIVGMIDVGFGLPSTLGLLDETPKEEPSFKDWKSTIRKNLGKVGKINAAVTLGKEVYKSLQPPKEGEPDNLVTPYSVGESISNTAKDLFSSTEEVVSPPSPPQTSMNPEYNLPSEMQQSLQPKPTPAYMTDSRPFEERLQEYRQYMQNLREGK